MKTSSQESHTDRNNEEEQAGTSNGIYSGQTTECEKHSVRLSLDAIIALYCLKINRVVKMLSTMHSQPEIESTLDQKPSIILFRNKTKGGVGTLDRMLRSYFIKHITRRWPLVLFYTMIDVSTINAFMQGINHDSGAFR